MRRWKRQSSLYFPLNTTKSPRHYISNKQMTKSWRKEGRPAKNLRIQGTQYCGEFLGFFFLPLCFGAKINQPPQRTKWHTPKKSQESQFSLPNGPGKRKLTRNSRESNHSFPAKYHRKNHSSTHINKSQVGSLDVQPCQAITKYFKELHQKAKQGNTTFISIWHYGYSLCTDTFLGYIREA